MPAAVLWDLEEVWPSRRQHAHDELCSSTPPPSTLSLLTETESTVSSSDDDPAVGAARRTALNEDWLATIVGLVLLLLVLAGVIPGWLIP
ncbi:hypothetical protein SAMN05443637_102164 [Pseudonocardia thermophila]|uniref:Uncharacterized protein n=1 Tax=Pseudonocardia thermophila TaxID=1848 RepID=A0A1M6PBD2_PSETH|nr:hypothetical protein SAMN05443637_102164 [Pseudonocardia thermophila]